MENDDATEQTVDQKKGKQATHGEPDSD